ncbi:hypothetical protein HAV21_03385 [Paenarthrobacter sp. MSM-2-10-13]|uniref:hypothetical protein n=1 Tax=Paenarthrobacter sp. MSM-2-10-13 TaxID=2717318 RepID=UPI00141EE3C2|nr:hypothetical protein [Paenarthrobacter sp. MSM-2-10-13]NHW45940.1 hypothetical protein [Paenarthrobacter sp. MSM-2-10-13]
MRSRTRALGKTAQQFQEFVTAANAGLRVEMHGQNYVAMSRNMYDELIKRADPITVTVDESQSLSDDVRDEIDRILAVNRKAKS